MNKKGKKRALIGNGTLIGAAVAALLIIFLLNPNWLPFSEKTTSKIAELEKANFLIERSGQITLAHWLTLLLAICVIWLLYTLGKLLLGLIGRKDVRARTITTMFIGGLKYLAVIAGVVWGLRILGVDTTAILAGIGIIGLILGFGAQSLIEDVITGLFIIFEGKYSIGDIIVLDDFRGIASSATSACAPRRSRTPATTSRSSTTPTSATSRTVRATPRWRSASAASPTRPTCARSRRCSTRA